MTQSPIRVLVADNHPMYREAVAAAVESKEGLEVVAEVGDGRAALDSVRALRPDVAVLDMRMPELEGMQVLAAIVREDLPTRVVFLSAHLDGGTVYAAISEGAAAYLSKDSPAQTVCETVATVADGGTVLPPEVHAGIAQEIRLRSAERAALTGREQEILRLASEGCSAPEMARRMNLSTGTVKTHLQSVYRKLGVSDRAAAVAEGLRSGLLD